MKKSLGSLTVVAPLPVWVVGSYDQDGRPNLATVAWGGVCCSKPPCLTVSLREATYTHGNILQRKAYTVNVPSAAQAEIADFCGIASGREVDKFQECSLTPVKSSLVDAPYAAEFPLVVECRVLHIFELGLHTQFVGEIMDVKIEESCLDKEGRPNIQQIDPIIYSTKAQTYHQVGSQIGRAYSIGKK